MDDQTKLFSRRFDLLFSKLLEGICAVSSAVIIEVSSGIAAGILNLTRCVVTDNLTFRFSDNFSDLFGIHAGKSANSALV